MNDSSTKSLMFQALFVLWFLIDLGHSNFFILSSKKIEKLNWNDFRKKNCKKLCKKIILGISDGWFMSHSSHQPSEPAYNIEDCRILDYVPSWLVLAEIKFLLHVSLPEWPINQFKLVQQIRQQGVRSYCPISKLCSILFSCVPPFSFKGIWDNNKKPCSPAYQWYTFLVLVHGVKAQRVARGDMTKMVGVLQDQQTKQTDIEP